MEKSSHSLDAIELVIQRRERDQQRVLDRTVGRADGRLHLANDQPHQIDDRGEQQRFLVLMLGVLGENVVEHIWREGVLHQSAKHDMTGLF